MRMIKYPWFSVLPIFIGLVVGQLVRFGSSTTSSGGLLLLDVALAWYVLWGIASIVTSRRRFTFSLPHLLFVAFTLWAGGSLAAHVGSLSTSDTAMALFYWIRLTLIAIAFSITPTLINSQTNSIRFTNHILVCGGLIVFLGYVQLLVFPNFGFMSRFGWDPHEGRLLSTFFDPNFLGMFLAMICSILVARMLITKPTGLQWVFMVVSLVALILTFSRSAYLAATISLVIILGIRSWRIMSIAMIVVTLCVIQVPRVKERIIGAFQLDTTAHDRIESWQESLVIIEDNLLAGVGYNAYGPASITYKLKDSLSGRSTRAGDSSLLLVTATTGLVGLGIYLSWLFTLLWQSMIIYQQKASPYFESIGLAMLGIIPAYIIHSQFVNGLFYPLLIIPFLLLTSALPLSLYKSEPDR